MIEIRSLTKDYGSFRAVDDLNLKIPQGQVVGLLGPNGAGKTTTLRVLTGYMPPTSGAISVGGYDCVSESPEVRRRLGYLPESNPLYSEMRVEEYLRFRARIFEMPRVDRAKAIERVIERCWLREMRKRLIGHLSKGYRQRVGLAAALLHSPPVLILDEPTSGLDPVQIRETRNLIRELSGEHTMIISSHILPEVERTVDRIVIITQGKIRADGTVEELRDSAGDSGHYRVEVHGASADGLVEGMRKLAGVHDVRSEALRDGWQHLVVTSKHGAGDLREVIGEMIRDGGVHCRELMRESDSLEQLFVRIAMGDDDEAAVVGSVAGGTNGEANGGMNGNDGAGGVKNEGRAE